MKKVLQTTEQFKVSSLIYSHLKIQIDLRKMMFLALAFVVFTIIGTLSHEYGHILVAQKLGYSTTLHYGSMTYHSEEENRLNEIHKANFPAIRDKKDFKEKVEYERLSKKLKHDSLWISIGGPSQTILTGTLGLFILFIRKRILKKKKWGFIDWLATFLSLFWLREIFNLLISVTHELISPNGSYFSGDEQRIASLLHLWPGILSLSLGLIAAWICLIVIFKIVPYTFRLTFIASGIVGGIFGFVLWMHFLGPLLLP